MEDNFDTAMKKLEELFENNLIHEDEFNLRKSEITSKYEQTNPKDPKRLLK